MRLAVPGTNDGGGRVLAASAVQWGPLHALKGSSAGSLICCSGEAVIFLRGSGKGLMREKMSLDTGREHNYQEEV
jgi:hypothetical protein